MYRDSNDRRVISMKILDIKWFLNKFGSCLKNQNDMSAKKKILAVSLLGKSSKCWKFFTSWLLLLST